MVSQIVRCISSKYEQGIGLGACHKQSPFINIKELFSDREKISEMPFLVKIEGYIFLCEKPKIESTPKTDMLYKIGYFR